MSFENATGTVQRLREELTTLKAVPTAQARTMPPEYYTSEAFLQVELEEIFQKEWICVGHLAEVASAGDYFTITIGSEPLLVVRDEQGTVRVLSNVCRHRGNLVAQGSGNRKRFSCSYHSWTYAADGRLVGAPLMNKSEAFKKEACSLPEFASEIWQDFIFVDFSGTAPSVATRLDSFIPTIANYHHLGRHKQFVGEEIWGTNWKCLVENFMEGYHLSSAHLKTLHPITPTALCEKIPAPFGMTAYVAGYDPRVPERGPYHEDLTPGERRRSVMFAAFPNLVVGIVPNVTIYIVLTPIDADHVALKWGLAGNIADPQHPDVIAYRDLCFAFNTEDREQLEGVQKGLKSKHYRSGPLAPPNFEGTIWDFYQYVAAKLASDAALQSNPSSELPTDPDFALQDG